MASRVLLMVFHSRVSRPSGNRRNEVMHAGLDHANRLKGEMWRGVLRGHEGKNAQMQPSPSLTMAKQGKDEMSSPEKITEGSDGAANKGRKEKRRKERKGKKKEPRGRAKNHSGDS